MVWPLANDDHDDPLNKQDLLQTRLNNDDDVVDQNKTFSHFLSFQFDLFLCHAAPNQCDQIWRIFTTLALC